MTRRAFVSGAEGFIGSHLVELLVAEGYAVRALSQYNAFGTRGWLDQIAPNDLEKIEVLSGDVRDAAFVREAVADRDVIFHLAALIGIPYSYVAPESYVDANIVGTLNLLQAARDRGEIKVIHTSTSEVYGTPRSVPIGEDHALQAQSPYAATKIAADQLALSFQRSFGLPVVVVRPFNTYGPRQSRRAIIPAVITQLLAGEQTLRLGNLHPTRDLTFVKDTARGFLLTDRCEKAVGEVINLGTGFEITIGDLAGLIAELMGIDAKIVQEDKRVRPDSSEVERLLADAGKAERLLGWKPNRSGREGLVSGLQETIAWFRAQSESAPGRATDYVL